jgi:hypothetical protein
MRLIVMTCLALTLAACDPGTPQPPAGNPQPEKPACQPGTPCKEPSR